MGAKQFRLGSSQTVTVSLDVTTAKTLLIALTNALQGGGKKVEKSLKSPKAAPKAGPKGAPKCGRGRKPKGKRL
jgi:hypothetical protein